MCAASDCYDRSGTLVGTWAAVKFIPGDPTQAMSHDDFEFGDAVNHSIVAFFDADLTATTTQIEHTSQELTVTAIYINSLHIKSLLHTILCASDFISGKPCVYV